MNSLLFNRTYSNLFSLHHLCMVIKVTLLLRCAIASLVVKYSFRSIIFCLHEVIYTIIATYSNISLLILIADLSLLHK